MPAVTATGVPNPPPSKERAEAERDQQQLQPASSVIPGQQVLHVEAAVLLGELLQEDDVEHDPADRQQPGETAEHRRRAGHAKRHAVSEHRHGQRRDEAEPGRDVRLMCRKPSDTSITTTGTAASSVEINMLPNGS